MHIEFLVWFALLAVTMVLFTVSTVTLGINNQEHHYWYGAYAVALGAVLILLATHHITALIGVWCARAGLVACLDDSTQHAIQIFKPNYRSPLHLLYRYLIYNPTHHA